MIVNKTSIIAISNILKECTPFFGLPKIFLYLHKPILYKYRKKKLYILMKVLFYSEKCQFSIKLLAYLEKYNMQELFKMINIDTNEAPPEIDSVPTIIDTEMNQPLKGRKVFEYLVNIKYFNNPTNNIEYIKDIPANPEIPEDDKAIKSKNMNLELDTKKLDNAKDDRLESINEALNETLNEALNEALKFYDDNKNNDVNKNTQNMVNERRNQDKKLSILLRLRQ